jgi:succinate dehydrogenase/fumarate reductase-like Fe-S protein
VGAWAQGRDVMTMELEDSGDAWSAAQAAMMTGRLARVEIFGRDANDVERLYEFRKCIECWLCQDVCHVLRQHRLFSRYYGPRLFVHEAYLTRTRWTSWIECRQTRRSLA